MYGSLTPCKGHISAMKKNAKSYDILMKSEKYHPILVYGDKDAAGALEFAKTLGKPVFLDPGRKLAKILGVKWYLVAVFDEKGKSRVFRHGIGLIPKKELPELLDKDVEK
ncbi:MAG: TlpA family protein disulfide reductase, partial [Vulcanimicrobiota bacterium]